MRGMKARINALCAPDRIAPQGAHVQGVAAHSASRYFQRRAEILLPQLPHLNVGRDCAPFSPLAVL